MQIVDVLRDDGGNFSSAVQRSQRAVPASRRAAEKFASSAKRRRQASLRISWLEMKSS